MSDAVVPRSERVVAAVVQAAPLLGIPFYVWAAAGLDNMLFYFFPGVYMLAAGLVVALLARPFARTAFLRAQSGASLRFHAVLAAVTVVLFALLFWAFWAGVMSAAGTLVLLFGVILSLVEIARALICGIGALRAAPPPPLPES